MRAFIGFLMQDEAGLAVTVSGMTPTLIKRFIAWRSGAHSYAVPWKGKHYNHTSKGITGEKIGRASCRERVDQYVQTQVVAATLKTKNNRYLLDTYQKY